MDAADIPSPACPIPGSMLMAGVSKHYVTISGPTAKVIMSTRDARALMGWLYDMLPPPLPPEPPVTLERTRITLDRRVRMNSMSHLRRLRQEARA